MTKEELLRIMRLLSAIESVMLMAGRMPDHLYEEITFIVDRLETEILK